MSLDTPVGDTTVAIGTYTSSRRRREIELTVLVIIMNSVVRLHGYKMIRMLGGQVRWFWVYGCYFACMSVVIFVRQ
jgi:hypothetical protein